MSIGRIARKLFVAGSFALGDCGEYQVPQQISTETDTISWNDATIIVQATKYDTRNVVNLKTTNAKGDTIQIYALDIDLDGTFDRLDGGVFRMVPGSPFYQLPNETIDRYIR